VSELDDIVRQDILLGLAALSPRGAKAEDESEERLLKGFLPTPPFVRACDPQVILVLGGRGAGKTELFRVLELGGVVQLLFKNLHGQQPPLLVMFDQKQYPISELVAQHLAAADDLMWRTFWLGLLARQCMESKEPLLQEMELPDDLRRALTGPATGLGWLPLVQQHLGEVQAALDQLDQRLVQEQRYLYACYDELDRLSFRYAQLFPPVRALLGLWHDRFRRWQRIRPKVFLRNDIFESRLLAFPDASKLFSGHKVELEWTGKELYGVWIKRMLNSGPPLSGYVRQNAGADLTIHQLGDFGLTPALSDKAFRPVQESLVGRYMGSNPRKGASYSWVVRHVQDSQGRLAPRSFLKLMSAAANSALARGGHAGSARLLSPIDFHAALVEASRERLAELQEEDGWIELLEPALEGELLPMERDRLERVLGGINWPANPADTRTPPTDDPGALVEVLVRRGVFEARTDGRLNVPVWFSASDILAAPEASSAPSPRREGRATRLGCSGGLDRRGVAVAHQRRCRQPCEGKMHQAESHSSPTSTATASR